MNNKGQAMVEVAIALAIALVIITALMSLVLTSLTSAQYSSKLNDATQYTQEGLEIVRALNGNYNETHYCLGDSLPPLLISEGDDGCPPNVLDEKFIRSVELRKNACDGGLTKVIVSTSWEDGKCQGQNTYCQKSTQATCVSNI